MARYNNPQHKVMSAAALATSPIATVSTKPNTRTFQGASGWTRTAKAELFLRATGGLHGGETDFYESADKRDDRLRELVREVVRTDYPWLVEFATWLRGPGNMRTASLMMAVEAVHEDLAWRREATGNTGSTGTPYRNDGLSRHIVNAVCRRPDEPGELLAIWTAWFGRRIPKPIKRGLADAVRRLYSQKAFLKYDTGSHTYRFADVLELVHAAPDPDKPWQGPLFKYAIDKRHNRRDLPPPVLATVQAHDALMALPVKERRGTVTGRPELLRAAGMTWEALAGWLQGPMDRDVWETMIPSMPIMARIKNLRNFDQAGVSDKVAQQIMNQLTDPDEIAKSRQFPFRFLAAYRATKEAGSLRWMYPLEQALNHSLINVPSLGGYTLILVDRSPSMFPQYDHLFSKSKISNISRADQAAVFGAALAVRAERPTLVEFHGSSRVIPLQKGTSVLPLVEAFGQDYGTDIPSAVRKHYDNHDRVIILTDEQTKPGYLPSNMNAGWSGRVELTSIDALVPLSVPVYMWNFAGYSASAMASGSNSRFTLGGLTDSAFRLVPLLEGGAAGVWPWQLDHQG